MLGHRVVSRVAVPRDEILIERRILGIAGAVIRRADEGSEVLDVGQKKLNPSAVSSAVLNADWLVANDHKPIVIISGVHQRGGTNLPKVRSTVRFESGFPGRCEHGKEQPGEYRQYPCYHKHLY